MFLLDLKIPDMLLVFLIHTTVMLTVIAQHNLTPYGTATQSSHYKGTFGRPENAIHPPISNKWSGNICTHTIVDRSSTPADWWMFQFSFGSAYITNITIYYREGWCQQGFWGSNCSTTCADNCIEGNCFPGNGSCVWGCDPTNCFNNVCNRDTAICTDGCKKGRTGNHCNKYNLASYSLVTQNPSGSLPAILAIDGNKTSCSKTQGLTVIFQVDLKKARAVTEIFVIFVEHITTVGDHIVYASNTSSSWKNGTVLHKGKALPAEVNFFTVFRYLTFEPLHLPQQPFVILELCEIGVIGCPPGHYGSNCTKSCPKKCQGPCEPENGNCTFGCISGWTGEKCGQACNGGKYGKDCLQECSANCLTPPCDHITGECSNGCNDGWLGSNCTQKCPKGHFGQKCLKSCDGCLSNLCEHIEGLCHNNTACKPGYAFGEYCNTACINGNFGTNCSDFCDGCLSFTCNHVDGLCADKNACNAGYVFGDYCNKECSIGQFGTNCSEICKGCRSYMCDNADGLCDDTDTCNPGYFYGDYCNKEMVAPKVGCLLHCILFWIK